MTKAEAFCKEAGISIDQLCSFEWSAEQVAILLNGVNKKAKEIGALIGKMPSQVNSKRYLIKKAFPDAYAFLKKYGTPLSQEEMNLIADERYPDAIVAKQLHRSLSTVYYIRYNLRVKRMYRHE